MIRKVFHLKSVNAIIIYVVWESFLGSAYLFNWFLGDSQPLKCDFHSTFIFSLSLLQQLRRQSAVRKAAVQRCFDGFTDQLIEPLSFLSSLSVIVNWMDDLRMTLNNYSVRYLFVFGFSITAHLLPISGCFWHAYFWCNVTSLHSAAICGHFFSVAISFFSFFPNTFFILEIFFALRWCSLKLQIGFSLPPCWVPEALTPQMALTLWYFNGHDMKN